MSKLTKTVLGALIASLAMVASLNLAIAMPEAGEGPDPAKAAERQQKMLDNLQKELDLSEEQVQQMHEVMDKNRAEMEKIREQVKAQHEQMQTEMKRIMSEEQAEKFEAMKQGKREAAKEKKKGWFGSKNANDGEGKKGGRNNY